MVEIKSLFKMIKKLKEWTRNDDTLKKRNKKKEERKTRRRMSIERKTRVTKTDYAKDGFIQILNSASSKKAEN